MKLSKLWEIFKRSSTSLETASCCERSSCQTLEQLNALKVERVKLKEEINLLQASIEKLYDI